MEPVNRNNKFKNKNKLGSLGNAKRIMNKYNLTYYDYMHIIAYREFPSEMLSEDNIRKESFNRTDNLYLDELRYYSNICATEQEFSSSFDMYSFASNTVNVLLALSCSVAFLMLMTFMSSILNQYKILTSIGVFIFASFLYHTLLEHKGYLILSRLLYPTNFKFKLCSIFSFNLCRIILTFSLMFSLFTAIICLF